MSKIIRNQELLDNLFEEIQDYCTIIMETRTDDPVEKEIIQAHIEYLQKQREALPYKKGLNK